MYDTLEEYERDKSIYKSVCRSTFRLIPLEERLELIERYSDKKEKINPIANYFVKRRIAAEACMIFDKCEQSDEFIRILKYLYVHLITLGYDAWNFKDIKLNCQQAKKDLNIHELVLKYCC